MDETENANPMDRYLEQQKQAQEALTARYKALQDSLTQRRLPFDPMLMRLAIGLSKGSKSGTFGEEISNAMTEVLDQSEKEATRQQSILKAQAELEEKILEMRRREATAAYVRGRYNPGQRPPTVGAAAGMGASSGVSADMAPAVMPPVGGTTLAGPMGMSRYDRMSDADLASLMSSEGKSIPEIEDALEKRRRDNIIVRDGFVYNVATGEAEGSGKPVTIRVLNPNTNKWEPHETFENVSFALSRYSPTDPRYKAIVREKIFAQDPTMPTPPVGASSDIAAPAMPTETVGEAPAATTVAQAPRRPTATESAASAAGIETEAKETAKEGVTAFTKSQNAYQGAPTLFNTAETMNRLVYDNPRAFELLSKPGIANAIMRAADQGIQIGLVGSIKLPAAELSKYKLSQEDLDTLNVFANQMAIAKNANRQMTRVVGEGAMSDFETQLANQMLDVPNASPEAIRMINQYTMMRARHLEQKHELWAKLREQGMSATDALTSPQMRDLEQGYQGALRAVAQQNASILSSAASRRKQPKAAPAGAITPEAIEAERKRRGLQ